MTKENAYAIVQAARSAGKVTGLEIINQLFDNFFELHGDRNGTDDPAIIGGLATYHGRPVTVITTDRGKTVGQRVAKHFGSPAPGGYRKALRLIENAAKFHRPVIALVNTAGATRANPPKNRGKDRQLPKTCSRLVRLRPH